MERKQCFLSYFSVTFLSRLQSQQTESLEPHEIREARKHEKIARFLGATMTVSETIHVIVGTAYYFEVRGCFGCEGVNSKRMSGVSVSE